MLSSLAYGPGNEGYTGESGRISAPLGSSRMSNTVSICIDGEIASEIVIVSLENMPRFALRAACEDGERTGKFRADI
jgi:hypothetical protein